MTPLERLRALHDAVDERAREIAAANADRIVCARGCIGCCADDLTVFEIEADRIRSDAAAVLRAQPREPGRCAFLAGDGACRIYDARPYVCRTQGLPLRWIDEEAEAEYRDICELNDPAGPPLEELEAGSCWTLGEVEERLRELQLESGRALRRVALRELFDVRD